MKHIKTFIEQTNESVFDKSETVVIPVLKPGQSFRVIKDFNAADLPWEKVADSFLGKFRRLNINAEGVQNYGVGQSIAFNLDGKIYIRYYDTESAISINRSHKYSLVYPDKAPSTSKDDNGSTLNGPWFSKLIYLALKEGLIKIDDINDVDLVNKRYSDIYYGLTNHKKVYVGGIEVLRYDDIKFDYNKGYLTVDGYSESGERSSKKETVLFRNLLKTEIRIED